MTSAAVLAELVASGFELPVRFFDVFHTSHWHIEKGSKQAKAVDISRECGRFLQLFCLVAWTLPLACSYHTVATKRCPMSRSVQ